MGDLSTIKVDHLCPKCTRNMGEYSTYGIEDNVGVYAVGHPVNTGRGPNFELRPNFKFDISAQCDPCDITIEGTGLVRDYVLVQVKESGYRNRKDAVVVDTSRPVTFMNKGTVYFADRPLISNERIIASAETA